MAALHKPLSAKHIFLFIFHFLYLQINIIIIWLNFYVAWGLTHIKLEEEDLEYMDEEKAEDEVIDFAEMREEWKKKRREKRMRRKEEMKLRVLRASKYAFLRTTLLFTLFRIFISWTMLWLWLFLAVLAVKYFGVDGGSPSWLCGLPKTVVETVFETV
jgi:hypothetical protein